jgi:hypothetical protein
MARGASAWPEPQRRHSVKGLIHERIRIVPTWQTQGRRGREIKPVAMLTQPFLDCSEADIFQAAYGDPEGRDYWQAWLFEQRPAPELADLLATHVAENDDELHRIKRVIVDSLEGYSLDDTFDRTLWLFENPNTRQFIPESLARLLMTAVKPKQDKVETQDGGPGPRPGQSTPKARACEIALEIPKKKDSRNLDTVGRPTSPPKCTKRSRPRASRMGAPGLRRQSGRPSTSGARETGRSSDKRPEVLQGIDIQ